VIWLIISIIVALLGTTAIFIGRINETDRRGDIVGSFNLRPIGVAVLAVGLIVLAFDSFTIVPTRNLAVQTSFGKPTGTLRNGFHPAAPWSDIHTFDATIQTLKMSADDTKDQGDPITVRLANAATAKVDVTVQWQIDPDADITQLYLDFRDFDNIGNNVVRRQLSAAMNAAFERYDPLVSLKANNGDASGKTLGDLSTDVKAALTGQLPTGIKVRSVLIPRIDFDENIQAKINQYLAALAETQIAEQRQQTAAAQKKANDLLAVANSTPAVLYQNCLDMVERLTRDGKALPAAFTCGTGPLTVVPVGAK
jgi:regulator of protease activity HflC (stomatin/prohibitin superfamily)